MLAARRARRVAEITRAASFFANAAFAASRVEGPAPQELFGFGRPIRSSIASIVVCISIQAQAAALVWNGPASECSARPRDTPTKNMARHCFLPLALRSARVIGTDALRLVLTLREPGDGQKRKQDSEDDPDINAHQSSLAAALPAPESAL